MKKTISILLVLILLLSNITTVFAANEEYSKKQISLIYGGKKFIVDVFKDENGVLYAPIDWMSYFGLYEYKETEDEYVFFCANQDENHDFAKRIYISKDGKHYALSYYTDIEGLYKNQLIYQDSDFSKEMLNYLNSNYPGTASYQPILSGTFGNSFFEEDTLYLPLAEMLPFFNAKIGITENQELYISPKPMSLSQAMYSIDVADLAFNAYSDMVGEDFISFTAYTIDTFNVADPRLDRLAGLGEENDFKTIFKEYLIDNKAYLSAFDEKKTPSPSSVAFGFGKDLTTFGKTGLSIVSDSNKLSEYVSGIKELAIQTTSWSEICSDFAKVSESDIVGGAYKMFDYWYHYTNQIDDHRKMLGAVYNYGPYSDYYTSAGIPSYSAAASTQKLYGEDDSKRFLAAADSAMKEIGMDFLETAVDAKLEFSFLPYTAAYNLAKLIPDFKDAVEQIESYSLLYVVDDSTRFSTNTYFDMRYSGKYDSEALENLRLCAMHSLVASRHAYISLWDKDYNHPKIERIEEALVKLYLAADGVECDSSDYYGKKKAELKKEIKIIKTTDGWSDNEGPINSAPTTLSDHLGMTVDEIAAIWGEDYKVGTDIDSGFYLYYEDDRLPFVAFFEIEKENPANYLGVDNLKELFTHKGLEESVISHIHADSSCSLPVVQNLKTTETLNTIKDVLGNNGFITACGHTAALDSYSIKKSNIQYYFYWSNDDEFLTKEEFEVKINNVPSESCNLVLDRSTDSQTNTTVDTTLSSKQITIEEAYRIAERHYFGNNSNTAGYSFAAESIFEYEGVSYYPIKVSFDLGTHTSYAGLHLFVSLDGKTVLEGAYAYGTNGDDLYGIYEE